ncbi:MAG: TRAP transporter substrate-binding protein DctP [Pseudomonadota bacterium]
MNALSLAVAATLSATPLLAEEVTLRGVSCFPIGSPPSVPFEKMVEEINARGEGVVQIELLGGAPAIGSPFQVADRMALGAYDIAGCPESYFGSLVPEAPALRLHELPYDELRANGAIDAFQERMNAKGAYYVGRHHSDGKFHLFLSEPIEAPDLSGLNLRVSPNYTAFFKSMGATVQRSSMPEVYTLMENGTVDGYGWALRGISPSWYKVTSYRVDPGFYNAPLHTIANLQRWNGMSDEARAVITDIVMEAEARTEAGSDWTEAADAKMVEVMEENGIATLAFEGEEADLWVAAAREAAWAEFLANNPDTGPGLQALFTGMN